MSFLITFLTLVAAGATDDPRVDVAHVSGGGGGARILLSDQAAQLLPDGAPPALRVSAVAENLLTLPVRAVRIGVLFADRQDALRDVEASKLYHEGPPPDGRIGVINERVAVALGASSKAPVSFRVAVPANAPQPAVFLTHILGYELAAADATTLLNLLGTAAAADEVAACSTLGLGGDRQAKAQARQLFGDNRQLVVDLGATLSTPPPGKPTQLDTFRRVYAIRALGVLGGPTARSILEDLLRSPSLAVLDEPMQVLRVARLVGTPLETPLAFAIPPEARRMRDVVAAALDDVVATAGEAVAAPAGQSAPAPATVTPDAVEGHGPRLWRYGIMSALALAIALFGWRWRQRETAPASARK